MKSSRSGRPAVCLRHFLWWKWKHEAWYWFDVYLFNIQTFVGHKGFVHMPDTEFGLNRCWCSSFQNLHCHLHEKPNISKSMAIPSIRPHVLLVKGGVRGPMCTNRLCPRFFRIGSLNETPMFISRLFTVCFFVNRVVSSKEASVSSVYIIEFINFQNI